MTRMESSLDVISRAVSVVSLAPLDPLGTSVTLVVGPIPEHCTFQYLP
jgi:hypothetical protein